MDAVSSLNQEFYTNIVLGGTFDLLHIGHKHLLDKAFGLSDFVTIGLTSDKFNRKRAKTTWESEVVRREILDNYLKSRDSKFRYQIILIDDVFGTSAVDTKIQAIITTKETLKNVRSINAQRVINGLKRLDIVMVGHTKDSSGKIISSSRIRDGEISPKGENYKDLLLKIADKKINKKILARFKSPLGKIIYHPVIPTEVLRSRGPQDRGAGIYIMTVGDITTRSFIQSGFTPKLSIIDFKTGRTVLRHPEIFSGSKKMLNQVQHDILINPPGQISGKLIQAISQAFKSNGNSQIVIEGEEDLATIPAILLSPFGTRVYYGQPNKGIVEVLVNQQIKDKICYLIDY